MSGEVPEEAVVSRKTGHVFEKRLIEKHIQETGRCPVSGQDLSLDDLIALQTSKVVRPRAPAAASIPGVLKIMQSEWDALMLETYSLKQNLHAAREELSKVAYQHDAACRVIAKLVKERDQARAALLDVRRNVGAGAPQAEAAPSRAAEATMEVEEASGALGKAVVAVLTETASNLSKPRKKNAKAAADAAASSEQIAAFSLLGSHAGQHSAAKPGILCLDISSRNDNLILTGGADATAVLINRTTGKVEDTLKGHKKAVAAVKFHPTKDFLFTASHDGTTMIWGAEAGGKHKVVHTLKEHKGEVVGVSVHPSTSYMVTASSDGSWNFYDANNATLLTSVHDEKARAGFTCAELHPDGLILGAGANDSVVHIYDVKQQKNVCTFSEGHNHPISSISFSENGYFLASGDVSGVVRIWDLRKLAGIQTLTHSAAVNAVKFDQSGSYLAVGGADVTIYRSKEWGVVKQFVEHTAPVTGVHFGARAHYLASTSKDRSLKIFGGK